MESGSEFQVIRAVRDGLILIAAHDGRALEKEEAGKLVCIFLEGADAVLKDGSFDPTGPDSRVDEVECRVSTPEREHWIVVDGCVRVADAFDLGEAVIVEVGLGALGSAEMDEYGASAARSELVVLIGNVADGLPAERAAEVTQEYQQDRGGFGKCQQ